MPVISIITPVVTGKHHHIGETYRSLTDQRMPAGWAWEWVVQEDGRTGVPAAVLPDDDRITSGSGRPGRAAVARTMALARATGVLVRALDADDVLPPDALWRDITTLTEHPEIGWCVSPALDLLPDGEFRPGPRDPRPGRLPAGLLTEQTRAGLVPVVGTTLCTYTELVRALGGWLALPAAEDIALMLAAEAVADGWMHGEPGLIYRRWDGSSTAEPAHLDAVEKALRIEALLARADAVRATGWRWSAGALHRSLAGEAETAV